MSSWLFRFARWIAGPARAEWLDAIEVEALSAQGDLLGWAWGSFVAALRDRIARERVLLLSILLLPAGIYLLELALFFHISWLFIRGWIPSWLMAAILVMITLLPLGFALARIRPGLAAYLAAPLCFAIFHLIPMSVFWIRFRQSPLIWFGEGATIYMLPPFIGLGIGMTVVLAGVWLGSRKLKPA